MEFGVFIVIIVMVYYKYPKLLELQHSQLERWGPCHCSRWQSQDGPGKVSGAPSIAQHGGDVRYVSYGYKVVPQFVS